MKSLFTLLLAFIVTFSLMGQQQLKEQDIKDFKKQRISKKHHHGINVREDLSPRNPEYASRQLTRQFRSVQGSSLKAGMAAKQSLDSLHWEIYDATRSQWSLSDRELFTYDAQGNMVTYVWYTYDSDAMEILPFDKETVKHNTDGQPTEITWLIWVAETGQWQNYVKYELSYDDKGNLITEIISDWDPEGQQWQVGLQFEMTYDGEGKILSELWLYWDEDSSGLLETYKDEYIYEDGVLTTLNEYVWEEGVWQPFLRTTFVYDAAGNLTEELTQILEPATEQLFEFSKVLYTYNDADQLIIEEEWELDYEIFMMVQTMQYSYAWDADGDIVEQVDKFWDEGVAKGSNSWSNDLKYEWTYNKSFILSDIYGPYWFQDFESMNFTHMPVVETDFIYVDGDWVMDYRQSAYYSDFGASTDIDEAQESQIKIFPIPAAEQLTFSWEDSYGSLNLELYDLTGKLVISRSIDNNEIIAVDQLPGGIYLYKLIDNSHPIHSGKISIE